MGDPVFKVHSERWTEDLFGEGPMLGHDHVMLPGEWLAKLPPRADYEVDLMQTVWDKEEVTAASRLACCVTLTKELDGIVVFLPDRVPDDAC
jgi:hypothetical protein